MTQIYNSFLICENDVTISLFSSGIELMVYNKQTKLTTISAKSPDKLEKAMEIFNAASGLISLNKEAINKHFSI